MKHVWQRLGLLLLIAVIGGGTSPLVKYALQVFPPFALLSLRFATASLVLLPFAWGELRSLERGQFLRLCGLSMLAAMNVILFVYGVRSTSAIVGQTLYVGVPVITVIVAYYLKIERVTLHKIFGVILGLVGSLMIILLPAWSRGTLASGSIGGNLLIGLAVICFTLYGVLSKRIQKLHSPLLVTTMFMLVTAIITTIIAPFEPTVSNWSRMVTWPIFASVVYLGVVGSGIFYWLYQYAIKREGAGIATLVFYLLPIASFGWAYLLLGEVITLEFVLGATLVFWGAAIAGKR